MLTFTIEPKGAFSLAASIRFLEGFTPAVYDGGDGGGGPLRLAFPTRVSEHWETLFFAVRQKATGEVLAETEGDTPSGQDEVARILSLNVDGTGFTQIDDPIVKALQGRFAGLRPVCFHTPYEAAAWSVIGQRIRMTQAARIKARLAAELGESVEIAGERVAAFPTPERLLELEEFSGLNETKVDRLHAVARAALDGALEPRALRALPVDDALASLQAIPGIGPFSAELILIRGAGHPDVFPRTERRLHAAMGHAYGVDPEDVDRLAEIAATWSPYRSWVGLLFRSSM